MGAAHRTTPLSSRDDILAAISRAAVPPSPKAAPLSGDVPPALIDQFLAMLVQVGGRGIVRGATESLHEVAAALQVDQPPLLIRGRFAVAENGAVYVDADDLGVRTDVVSAEHLVLVVPANAIVPTMHEAVRLIPGTSRCGWFLSGPSKTADIEQALVVGAQGARTLHVILEP